MAKRSVRKVVAVDEKEIVYFLLITLTSKGRVQKHTIVRDEQRSITNLVNQLSGSCELFSVPGPYDFISRVQGVSAAGAIQILQLVEAGGNVKAHLVPAFRMYK